MGSWSQQGLIRSTICWDLSETGCREGRLPVATWVMMVMTLKHVRGGPDCVGEGRQGQRGWAGGWGSAHAHSRGSIKLCNPLQEFFTQVLAPERETA